MTCSHLLSSNSIPLRFQERSFEPMENKAVNGVSNGVSNEWQAADARFSTKAIHGGQSAEQWNSKIVIPPIHLGTTFKQSAPGKHAGFEYGRSGNPSRDVLEKCLAGLEGAAYGLAFASGLAANTAIANLLRAGDHVVSGDDVYGGTNRYFKRVLCDVNIVTDFVDATDPKNVAKALKNNTKLVWLESPTNPLLKIMDIPTLVKIVKDFNKDIIVVVDNTFLTPYYQKPLEMGVDLVVYSLTKYMNGHSDVIMGAVTTNNQALFERLQFLQNAVGLVPSPFDCFLVNRSLKTLAVRMREHMKNAHQVAQFLENHSKVEKVIFPGLPSHPHHELAKKLWSGCSGMISFYLKGSLDESNKFLSSLKVFTLAESLGGFESLAELPSVMTHASVPEEMRKTLGITDNLIRLSVGLESPIDLIQDLEQALKLV